MAAPARKVVLITGASSGLGEATAEACVAAGHTVVLAARRVDRLEQLAARLARPESILAMPCDIRDPAAIQQVVAAAESRFGRIDALVANAGVGHFNYVADCTEAELATQLEVNVLGVIRCAQAVLPGMLARRQGHILTVASVAAEIPVPGNVIYAATKGAVLTFSEGLRREVAPLGVHVTCILPGFIRSEMTGHLDTRMPPASIVGNRVVKLLRRPSRRAVVPRFYGAGIWLNRLAPGLIDWMIPRLMAQVLRRRQE